jgi:hypothetical protein
VLEQEIQSLVGADMTGDSGYRTFFFQLGAGYRYRFALLASDLLDFAVYFILHGTDGFAFGDLIE